MSVRPDNERGFPRRGILQVEKGAGGNGRGEERVSEAEDEDGLEVHVYMV